MNKEVLFLDDCQNRSSKFRSMVPFADLVSDAQACIAKLGSQDWDFVFLDHDLDGEIYVDESNVNTGSEVVRWVVDNKPKVGMFIVHSLNEPARANMVSKLCSAGYFVQGIPFINLRPDSVDVIFSRDL